MLPRSFKSWAVVGGKVVGIVVDLTGANEVMSAWPMAVNGLEVAAMSADNAKSCRAWAVKALAWLKAEAVGASEVDMIMRNVESHHETLNAFLKNLSQRKGHVGPTAKELCLARCGDLMGPLRAAHMEDLVDRCAEEMRRQCEDVLSVGPEVAP